MSNGTNRLFNGITNLPDEWLLDAADTEKVRKAAAEMMPRKEEKHFVGYEMKKLLGVRYLWIFLFVFLMLNSVIAWISAGSSVAAGEPADMIADFFAEYAENPSEIDAHYEEIKAFNEEQNRLYLEAIQSGNYDYEPETMPNRYSDVEKYPDSMLFEKLYSTLRAAEEYPELLDTVIGRAYGNLSSLKDMGIAENSFTFRYQLRVIDLYERMRESVEIKAEYTRGWQEYFSYGTADVFLFLMQIMLASLIFASEKQSGFLPILRTAKNGRAKTALAKIMTVLMLSCVFTLLFSLSSFAVFGLRLGFSSPDNVLQSLPLFTYSPYRLSIGAYFGISLGIKMLTFAVFSLLLLLLSVLFYNYVLIYISGLGLFGINYLLHSIRYVDANNLFRNLNLVTSAAVTPLFERYRALNFLGQVIGFVPAMLILFPCLLLLCGAGTVFLFSKGTKGIRFHWFDPVVSFAMMTAAELRGFLNGKAKRMRIYRGEREYSRSLFAAECFKTLISSRLWIVVLAILCVKCWYSVRINAPDKSYSDAVYKEYMTALEGELTEEKLAYLSEERQKINETLSRQEQMQRAYLNEEITFDAYSEYLSEYNYAYSRDRLLRTVENHASYLLEKEAGSGVRGWFVYDTGWNKLYQGDADLFLYVSLMLLFVGSFAAEYVSRSSSGAFAQLLRSTKNGRGRTFTAKVVSSGIIALVLALLTAAVDMSVVFGGYEMPARGAPLCSIESFSAVNGSITIGQYLVLFVLLRLAGALLMTLLICALSELLARYLPVLGSVAVLTLLPALCVGFGFGAADKMNFLNLLAGTPLFLQSAQTGLFGQGYALLALWLIVAMAAVWAMMVPAKRMFVR